MRIPRIYDPQPMMAGDLITLGDSASQHLGRVLRMKVGDAVILFNGLLVDGNVGEYPATITTITKKSVEVKLGDLTQSNTESPLQVHLGQCLSKGERFDYAIQKSTELGVTQITPLFSERTEVKLPAERAEKRTRHWQQIAISACEQSFRCAVPEIFEPQKLNDWLAVEADLKLVLDPRGAEPLSTDIQPTSIALLIGPEGGLSDVEVDLAVKAGFKPVSFGPRILRTETAPVVALSLLQNIWGDL